MPNTTETLAAGTKVTMRDGTGEATVYPDYRDEQGRMRYRLVQGRRYELGFVAGLHFEVA